MSRDNVEAVQAGLEAFDRGDLETLMRGVAEDVVIEQPPNQADRRTYVGHEGFAQAMDDWVGQWDDWSIEVRETIDADPYVLTLMYQHGRGKVSGVEVGTELACVFTVEDGKIARWEMFFSEEDAREAIRQRA